MNESNFNIPRKIPAWKYTAPVETLIAALTNPISIDFQ